MRRVGLEPKRTAIRGGTDGSALTEMGLPTPNLFTGGHDAHSEREWICVEDMGLAAATIVELAKIWAEQRPGSVSLSQYSEHPVRWSRSSTSSGRPLETLRISITDRCNFRCVYCMPKEVFGRDHAFLERKELLSFEEIARVAGVFAALGVRTVRITGGEPLVRRNVEHLVELLARRFPDLELALTTNGALLPQKAEALAARGPRPRHRQPRLASTTRRSAR